MVAPVSAITVSFSKRSVGPRNWISSPATSGAFPTSRLARRKDHMSKGPEGGKPLLPEAVAAGEILHTGLQPGLDHLDHQNRTLMSRVLSQAW